MEPNMETLTQTINIVIGGDGTGSLADTGVSLLPLIAIAVMLIKNIEHISNISSDLFIQLHLCIHLSPHFLIL